MPKSPAAIGLTMLALFVGGAGAGAAVGWRLDPSSEFAIGLGAIAMGVSFIASMFAWYGISVVWLITSVSGWMRKHSEEKSTGERQPAQESPIPLTFLFIPICAFVCAGFGLAIASMTRALFVTSFFVMLAIGAGYGWIIHKVARAGYLVPPEEI